MKHGKAAKAKSAIRKHTKAIVLCLAVVLALTPAIAGAKTVQLLQDIPGKGKAGDVIDVSDGYAKNFLFPRNYAQEVDPEILEERSSTDTAEQFRREQELDRMKKIAAKLDGRTIELQLKTTANGTVYGTITARNISDEIEKAYGLTIDGRKIECPEIKKAGSYRIRINLCEGVSVNMTVVAK